MIDRLVRVKKNILKFFKYNPGEPLLTLGTSFNFAYLFNIPYKDLTLFPQCRLFSTELLYACPFQEIVSGGDANTGACLLFALNPKTSKMICLEYFSLEQR